MKIVMDFRKFDGVIGGVERGVIEITKYIAAHGHQVVLLCKESRFSEVENLFEDVTNITFISLQVLTHVMSLRNAWIDSKTIQDIAEKTGADVIHFPYNWSFPLRKKVPTVLTVHDVIPFTFREAMGFFRNVFLYKPGIRQACRLNSMIATVSEFSKQDIVKKVGVPGDKIRVIPNGLREPLEPDENMDVSKKPQSLKEEMDAVEREVIRKTLLSCNWNQSQAARHLKISETNIRFKINQLGIRRDAQR